MRYHNASRCLSLLAVLWPLVATHAAPVDPTHAWLLDVQSVGTTPAAYGPHTGFLGGTPALSSDTPFGYAGNQSFAFSAADQDYVRINDAADLRPGTGAWSTSLWFKTSGAQFGALIAKQDSTGPGANNFWIEFTGNAWSGTPNSKISAAVSESGTDQRLSQTTNDVIDGNWHHLGMIRRATATDDDFEMFIDGALVAVTSLAETGNDPPDQRAINNTEPWLIGRNRIDAGGFLFLNGNIDEVAFWNSALSADDMAWLGSNSLASLNVVALVPEPSTGILLTMVGLGMLGSRQRGQRSFRNSGQPA